MRFGFFSLGCKVNQFEAEALSQLAQERGHEVVERDADAFVINTCTVTSVSDHKNIRAIHRIRRDNPRAVIAVCGCLAQMDPDKLERMGEVDLICGTSSRGEILTLCERAAAGKKEDTSRFRLPVSAFEELPAGVPRGRTRALLKVEDGCDNFCTYCIIPYARGHVRSLPLERAVAQAEELRQEGVQEIVVTGIEIASYGRDFQGIAIRLTDLIERLCMAVPDVRIRLSSLEPRVIDDAFCQSLSCFPNLVRHFHLSLQSGTDSVLRRMKRKYTTAQFLICLEKLRSAFPDCAVTTDLIVGFPGETAQEFEETMGFIRVCQFADIHVFPYSKRRGTVACTMPEQVPETVKQERALAAKSVAAECKAAYLNRFIGRTLPVLFENTDKNGYWFGHSLYSFLVRVLDQSCRKNQIGMVKITKSDGQALFGEVVALQESQNRVY